MKKVVLNILMLMFLSIFLVSCGSSKEYQIHKALLEKNLGTVENIYSQEFDKMVSEKIVLPKSDSSINGFGELTHQEEKKIIDEFLVNLENRTKQNNIIVEPYLVEIATINIRYKSIRDNAYKFFLNTYKDKFNPNYKHSLINISTPAERFAYDLTYGFAIIPTGFHKGDINQDFYYTEFIAGIVINFQSGKYFYFPKYSQRTKVRLLELKTPFISKNLNLRKAELAIKNLDFENAKKYYNLGKAQKADNLAKFEEMSAKFVNLPLKWAKWQEEKEERIRKKEQGRRAYLARKRAEQRSDTTSQDVANFFNAFNQGLQKKTNSLNNSNIGNTQTTNAQTRNSEDYYLQFVRRKSAVEGHRRALAELTGLEIVKKELIGLGKYSKNTALQTMIEKDIQAAQNEISRSTNYLQNLINKEGNLVNSYLAQNPSKRGEINPNLDSATKNKRLQELRMQYKYYYEK